MEQVLEDYQGENKNKIEVMVFDLALNLFFCLIRIYERQGIVTIRQMRTQSLRKIRQTKNHNKNLKIFYQIYQIFSEVFQMIGKCLYSLGKKTVN